MSDEALVQKSYDDEWKHVSLEIGDGCIYRLGPAPGSEGEWTVDIPDHFRVVCPHGKEFRLDYGKGVFYKEELDASH